MAHALLPRQRRGAAAGVAEAAEALVGEAGGGGDEELEDDREKTGNGVTSKLQAW